MKHYKITGAYQNGHGFEAVMDEADYHGYAKRLKDSTSDGSPLNMNSLKVEEIKIARQLTGPINIQSDNPNIQIEEPEINRLFRELQAFKSNE